MTTCAEATIEIPASFGFLFDPPLGAVRYRGSYSGRGAAKSWSFARALLIHGSEKPLRILCVREYQSSIKDSVHRLLSDQIEAMGLAGFYQVQKAAITGLNGTEIVFKGLRHDIAEIKSTEGIDLCWVEEAEAVSDASWDVLTPTIRRPGSEIWVSFNPALATDPTYQRFVDASSKRFMAHPDRAIVRRVHYEENPWLPKELREEAAELLKRDAEAHANIWGGEPWTRSDTQVLSGKLFVDDFTPQPGWNGPYYGADWGFAVDPAVLVRVWVGDSCLWVEYAPGQPQLNLDQTAVLFQEVPGAKEYVIRADSARPEWINEMNRRGFRMESVEKWPGSPEDGVRHLRGYERIVVHTRCERAIKELRLWRYKTAPRTGDVLPKLHDSNNHVADAIRYALAPLIRRAGGIGSTRVQMG